MGPWPLQAQLSQPPYSGGAHVWPQGKVLGPGAGFKVPIGPSAYLPVLYLPLDLPQPIPGWSGISTARAMVGSMYMHGMKNIGVGEWNQS